MFKGFKMIKLFLLSTLSVYIFAKAYINPYINLDPNEKINIMVNYFLNEELKTKLPLRPIKEILKDDGASLDPVKYEFYFSYIQRIKSIRESRAEDQQKIDEKYEGKVAFYNGKVNVLKNFYHKDEELFPILSNSVNKAFKVVYGKPRLIDVKYDKKLKSILAVLEIENIYNIDTFKSKAITIKINKNHQAEFLRSYEDSIVLVDFEYKNKILKMKNVEITHKENTYIGSFLKNTDSNSNEKIKLKIKINDDIFKPIKNEGKK